MLAELRVYPFLGRYIIECIIIFFKLIVLFYQSFFAQIIIFKILGRVEN